MRPRRLLRAALPACALLIATAVLADDAPPPKPPAAPEEVRETLPNGLEVVVMPSAKAKSVAVVMGYRAGARHEQEGEAGVAQLVARLLRRSACGSREAGAADQELAALGARARANTGAPATGADATHELVWTWATVPEDKLGVAREIERDRLVALKPTAALLDEVRADIFREPVKREARAWNSLIALAFPDSALGRPRLGSVATLSSLSLATVEGWRKAHIRVDAGVLVIAGGRDAKATLQAVKEKLGGIPKPETALAPAPQPPQGTKGPLRATIEGPSMARHVWLAFRGPEPGGEDEAAFLASVFALKDRMVTQLQGKAHDATVHADARTDAPALLVVSATPRPSTQLIDVEARARGAANMVRTEAPADLDKLVARVERMLDGLTAPLDATIQGAKDEPQALVEAAVDRALAGPLVARRDALRKNLKALTADKFLAKTKTILSEDRMSVVSIEPAAK